MTKIKEVNRFFNLNFILKSGNNTMLQLQEKKLDSKKLKRCSYLLLNL